MNGRGKIPRASSGIPNRPSVGRRSSIMGKGSASAQTETRPIGDRAFQQECIRVLCNFLTTHGYPNAVSPKVLQAPSGKDVTNIIQFLFHQVDPHFKFTKIEEDVPTVFKRLGYPVQISRSALYAAGSPVSWPSLLAALSWLVQLLAAMESSWDMFPYDDIKDKQLSDHTKEIYMHFLAGNDNEMERLDEEFLRQFEIDKERDEAELVERQAELDRLREELLRATTEPSPLAAAETKKRDLQDDIVKFQNIISGFAGHKETLGKKVNEKKQEFATKEEEILNVQKGNEELKEMVAAQQDYVVSVERMLKEREIINLNLESVGSRKEELEKAAWNLEVQSSKMLRDLETQVGQFNDSYERLKSAIGEESLDSYQFEMKVQPRAETAEEILGNTRKAIIKPGLREITQKCRKTLTEEIEPELLTLRQEYFAKKLALDATVEKVGSAIANHKKLELQYKSLTEKFNQNVAAMTAEREECDRRIMKEESAFQKLEEDLEVRLKEAELTLENVVRVSNEELQSKQTEEGQTLEMLMSSYEETSEVLRRVEEVTMQSAQLFDDLCLTTALA
ncbi:hypothetical protein R1flu_009367 [Riccia fluitans]|uniref:Kinetochore protein NDC80 n=1 Tax=Riccia fluitans TaxID=41844 RepID=A0ABD1Z2Q7_9MARC